MWVSRYREREVSAVKRFAGKEGGEAELAAIVQEVDTAPRGRAGPPPPPGRRLVFCIYLVYLVYICIYLHLFGYILVLN